MSNAASPAEEASPYVQKAEDLAGKKLTPTVKSYRNTEFLNGRNGRLLRIMCEFEEPKERLRRNFIRSTILFFGSARSMTRRQFDDTYATLSAAVDAAASSVEKSEAMKKLETLQKIEWMCEWVDMVEQLAKKVALFAKNEKKLINESFKYIPDYFHISATDRGAESLTELRDLLDDLVVTTGGGPGFMEAANRGAASVPGIKTIGMGISLPFEKGLNAYVTDGLAFEFHYFFTRKFWMMYSCRAIVVAPGGFGTLDELFELLTLKQTKKIPPLPVVLLGTSFWKTVVNWNALVDFGVISQGEVDSLLFTDDPDAAVEYIKGFYENLASGKMLNTN